MPAESLILNLRGMVEPIRRKPQIGIMLVVVALVMSGNGLVAPMLSIYAKTFAASTTLAGMVITIFGLARLLVNYPAGAVSQRYGRRHLLGAGPAIIAVGSAGAALAPSIEWLLFWRFVQGAGSGIYMTVSSAALADLARQGDRGRIMALQQTVMWLGSGLGPGIGGFLAYHLGLSAPFWAYGAVGAAAALMVWFCLDETTEQVDLGVAASQSTEAPQQLWELPAFTSLCLLYFATFFTRTASQWLLIPLIAVGRFKMAVDTVGLALTMLAVGTFVVLPLSGSVIDRFGAGRATVVAVLTSASALALLALGQSPVFFWAGLFLLGVGIGVSSPATSVLSAEILPRSRYGPGMGMLRTFGDAGFVVGPILVGVLDDFGSSGVVGGLLFNVSLLVLAVVIFAFQRGRPTQR
jgi:MFS transporter, DHA1 family, multidrug resistance protein